MPDGRDPRGLWGETGRLLHPRLACLLAHVAYGGREHLWWYAVDELTAAVPDLKDVERWLRGVDRQRHLRVHLDRRYFRIVGPAAEDDLLACPVELHGNDARCAVARDVGQSRGKSRLQQLLGNGMLEQRQVPRFASTGAPCSDSTISVSLLSDGVVMMHCSFLGVLSRPQPSHGHRLGGMFAFSRKTFSGS